MKTIARRKNCACLATSSGPRLIVNTGRQTDGTFLHARWVAMACDACDEPWAEVQEAPTREEAMTDGR